MQTFMCLIIVVWMCGQVSRATPECPNCADDSRKARLEYIKWQILQKLGLESPPTVEVPVLHEFVYEHLLHESSNEEALESFGKEDFYGKTRKVVIFPNESVDCELMNNITLSLKCYQLYIGKDLRRWSVSSADFWIYLPGINDTTTCTVVESPLKTENMYSVLAEETRSNTSSGWLRLDITKATVEWIQNKHFAPKLAVMCSNGYLKEFFNGKEPFISFHVDMKDMPNSRKKRFLDCHPNVTACCRETLEVSFGDFGWKWVISPRSYFANHCRGECLQDLSAAKYLHTTVLQAFLTNGPKKTNHTISLCCTPDILKPLTMIYMDTDSSIYKKVLPNMVIDSCSCAF